MIKVSGLTKRYGEVLAVDDLSFGVRPGEVTGFLGPHGAGKSSTMRVILGLNAPTSGTATVGGRPVAEHPAPLRAVGALLDASAVLSGRSAYHHLLALAASNGLSRGRVEKVLEEVGLSGVARRAAGTYSLGMRQRLGIAAALLGDPPVLVLDEPLNGLDPEGTVWIRRLMRRMAAEGRAVMMSSYLMSEVELTVDRLVVVGRGRLIADTAMADFIASVASREVVVPQAVSFAGRLASVGAAVRTTADEEAGGGPRLVVTGLDAAGIGALAAATGVELHELTPRRTSLEEAFMELTGDVHDRVHAGERLTECLLVAHVSHGDLGTQVGEALAAGRVPHQDAYLLARLPLGQQPGHEAASDPSRRARHQSQHDVLLTRRVVRRRRPPSAAAGRGERDLFIRGPRVPG